MVCIRVQIFYCSEACQKRDWKRHKKDCAGRTHPPQKLEALAVLVDALLDRARSAAWDVLRTAYREVNLRAVPCAPADMTGTTGQWLARSLVLGPRAAEKQDEEGGVEWYRVVEAWLEARLAKGEGRRKEGEGMDIPPIVGPPSS